MIRFVFRRLVTSPPTSLEDGEKSWVNFIIINMIRKILFVRFFFRDQQKNKANSWTWGEKFFNFTFFAAFVSRKRIFYSKNICSICVRKTERKCLIMTTVMWVKGRRDMKYETAKGNRSLKFFMRLEYVYFGLDVCVTSWLEIFAANEFSIYIWLNSR